MRKLAVLLDGGFVKKRLYAQHKRFPTVADIQSHIGTIMGSQYLKDQAEIFRIYYYDAPPYEGKSANPISKVQINFGATKEAAQNKSLLGKLELEPFFAVRRGEIIHTGWKLGKSALKSLAGAQRAITAQDLVPDMGQKGVDLRIGLDIAWISLKRLVDEIVLVTGDSDFVPAMKFARKEGIRIYLDVMDSRVRLDLKAHADVVLDTIKIPLHTASIQPITSALTTIPTASLPQTMPSQASEQAVSP